MGYRTINIDFAVNRLRSFDPVLVSRLSVRSNAWRVGWHRLVVQRTGTVVFQDRAVRNIMVELVVNRHRNVATLGIRHILPRGRNLTVIVGNCVLAGCVRPVFVDVYFASIGVIGEVGVVIGNGKVLNVAGVAWQRHVNLRLNLTVFNGNIRRWCEQQHAGLRR